MTLFTTGYAGHGETTTENIKAVLDQLLPPALGLVYIPTGLPRRVPAGQPAQQGLRDTIKWLVSEVGETGTIPVDDVIKALLERNASTGDDVVLVMLFDPESEADVELAKLALSQGIRVVDLCQAGDDLLFEEDTPEPPAAEQEVPVDDSDPPFETGSVAREVDAAYQPTEQDRARAASAEQMAQDVAAGGITVNVSFQIAGNDLNAIADAIVAAMGRQAQASLGQAVFDAPAAPPAAAAHAGEAASSAPAASPVKAPGSKAFYYNAREDRYRPARGIATDGETKVYLTPEQVKEMTEGGMIG